MARKSKSLNIKMPQDDKEVAHFIRKMGENENHLKVLQADMDNEILKVQDRYKTQSDAIEKCRDEFEKGICMYCETNRLRLTEQGKVQSHNFQTGTVKWRKSTKVTVAQKMIGTILDDLKKRKLRRFIREKFEVNKEAILDDPTSIRGVAGITLKTSETLTIEPNSTEGTARHVL